MSTKSAPSVWDNGKATISVEQKHIDDAMERNSSHCATAEAIKEAIPDARFVSVDLQTIRWTDPKKGLRYCFLTPHVVQHNIIIPFDQGDREGCKPITFRMKPAFVTKSGKKRTHTPDAAQLKELGLRVAKHQPHMPACETPDPGNSRLEPSPPTPAEKALADSWKPRSPDPWADMAGEGGQAPTPAPKRVARAKVSAVAKGVIPTTLGGKLPPQSVLSRREFGLRALRR